MIRIQLKKSQPPRKRKRLRNKARTRKKIQGTAERPRLAVFKSARHIYAQLVDDEAGRTLAAACSLQMDKKTPVQNRSRQAEWVGESMAKKALEKKIETVTFDRGGFIYHGRLKALAEGARKAGLKF